MIVYNPGKLGVNFICRLRGSPITRVLFWTLPCMLLAAVLQVEFKRQGSATLSELFGNEEEGGNTSRVFFSVFSSILGFFIALRLQTAYGRWWEAATVFRQLCAEWSHSFGTLMAFCNSHPSKYDEVRHFQHQAARLYSLLFGCALSQLSGEPCEVLDLQGFSAECSDFLRGCGDPCEVVMLWIQKLIAENEAAQVLNVPAPILSRVFDKLGDGMVNLSHAKKIKEFHIPFPLAQIHMLMLLCNTLVTPLFAAALTSTPWRAASLCFVTMVSYWSALYICLDLEEPFSNNQNNIPVLIEEVIFNKGLCTVLNGWTLKVPDFRSVNVDNFDIQKQSLDFTSGGRPAKNEKLSPCLNSNDQPLKPLGELRGRRHHDSLPQLEETQKLHLEETQKLHHKIRQPIHSSSTHHAQPYAGLSQSGVSRSMNRTNERSPFSIWPAHQSQSPKDPEDLRSFGLSPIAHADLDAPAAYENRNSNEDVRSSDGKDLLSASHPAVTPKVLCV